MQFAYRPDTHFHGASLTSTPGSRLGNERGRSKDSIPGDSCEIEEKALPIGKEKKRKKKERKRKNLPVDRSVDGTRACAFRTAGKSESCTTSDTVLPAGLRRIGSTDPIWVTRPSVCPSLYPFLSAFLAHHVRSFVHSFPPLAPQDVASVHSSSSSSYFRGRVAFTRTKSGKTRAWDILPRCGTDQICRGSN